MYAIVGWTLIVCTARGPFAPEAADRKTGVEFILSSTWVPENRLIPVNGGTAVHDVDKRSWKCTI